MYKEFIINKGWHRSVLFRPRFHYNMKSLSFAYTFDSSCLYDFPEPDKSSINKLYGVSFGHHHNNSIRLGWNCYQNNSIDIFVYLYNQKERGFFRIDNVEPGRKSVCYLHFDRYGNKIYLYLISDNKSPIIREIYFDFKNVSKFSYELFPFFGGLNVAPHKMKITIKDN